jgi:hypothetical protein
MASKRLSTSTKYSANIRPAWPIQTGDNKQEHRVIAPEFKPAPAPVAAVAALVSEPEVNSDDGLCLVLQRILGAIVPKDDSFIVGLHTDNKFNTPSLFEAVLHLSLSEYTGRTVLDWKKYILKGISQNSQADFIDKLNETKIEFIIEFQLEKYHEVHHPIIQFVMNTPRYAVKAGDNKEMHSIIFKYVDDLYKYKYGKSIQTIMHIYECVFVRGYKTKQDYIKMFVDILVKKYDLFVFGGAVMSEISGLGTNDIDIVGLDPDFNEFISEMRQIFRGEEFFKFTNKSAVYDGSKVDTYVLYLNDIEIEFDFVNFVLFEKAGALYEQEMLVKTRFGIIHRINLQKIGSRIVISDYLHHSMTNKAIGDLMQKRLTCSGEVNTTPKFLVGSLKRYFNKQIQGYICEIPKMGFRNIVRQTHTDTDFLIDMNLCSDVIQLIQQFCDIPLVKQLCFMCSKPVYERKKCDTYPYILKLSCCGIFVHSRCIARTGSQCRNCKQLSKMISSSTEPIKC